MFNGKNAKALLTTFLLSLVLVSCASQQAAPTPLDPATAVALAWTEVIRQQTENAPTSTFTPPPPTATPLPTVTPTPKPQPIILTGSGDSVVDVQKWNSVALMKVTYSGGSNFIVENFDKSGSQMDLLINTIGAYSGSQLIDIFDDDHTSRFQVTASGPWEIQILPVSEIRKVSIPGIVQGVGDDVVLLPGGSADILKSDASQATSNFIVYGLSNTDFYLLFNEIAPYAGSVIAQDGTALIQVKATGAWSIEVTTK